VPSLQPLRLLLTAVAGWVHREQAATIDYLLEENRVLREQMGKRRLRLTDDQRRRLAAKGVALGHRLLDRLATIVTPDTNLRCPIAFRFHRLASLRVAIASPSVELLSRVQAVEPPSFESLARSH